jgi:hypothetical protein
MTISQKLVADFGTLGIQIESRLPEIVELIATYEAAAVDKERNDPNSESSLAKQAAIDALQIAEQKLSPAHDRDYDHDQK